MGRHKKYQTEEERKAAKREYNKRWREKHPEAHREAKKRYYLKNKEHELERNKRWKENHPEANIEGCKRWREANPEHIIEYNKKYYETKLGRAGHLLRRYKRSDIDQNRGNCTLTTEWIVENIFSKQCHYCGETDWTKLGCDRIDNALPHTPDNVVPCCGACNIKRGTTSYDDYMEMIANGSQTHFQPF